MTSPASPKRRRVLVALGAAALATACGERAAPRPSLGFGGPTMGTTYSVKVAGVASGGRSLVRAAVEQALRDVVRAMSPFDTGSELSRLNRHPAGRPFALSGQTFQVLDLARRASRLTSGAFDVTVSPAVEAWGFGPGRAHRVPPPEELRALAGQVGWTGLRLDRDAGTATRARGDLRADLCGIAKGFAVDRAARALDALGIADYVIEAGGEVRARGLNAWGVPWQVGIEQPGALPGQPRFALGLLDLSMATSGDYRIFFERDGMRHCHEIDPATARTIGPGLASVTVLAPECAWADAMATALMVMGPRSGPAFCAAHGIAACFLARRDDGSLVERITPAFVALAA